MLKGLPPKRFAFDVFDFRIDRGELESLEALSPWWNQTPSHDAERPVSGLVVCHNHRLHGGGRDVIGQADLEREFVQVAQPERLGYLLFISAPAVFHAAIGRPGSRCRTERSANRYRPRY